MADLIEWFFKEQIKDRLGGTTSLFPISPKSSLKLANDLKSPL
jgi:hypothetical protein